MGIMPAGSLAEYLLRISRSLRTAEFGHRLGNGAFLFPVLL